MNKNQEQNFYPISMLLTFVAQIDQLIEALEEQYKLFIETKARALDVFAQKIAQGRNLNTKLIDLIKELKENTINKIIQQDDFELGLDCNLKTND